jgi:AcrR family transcriptional regulator
VPEPVKKRSYDRTTRLATSQATRQRILDAARELMLEHGYRKTTVAAIAQASSVNVDTVYRLVGRKPVLLRELIEQAVSGTDHPVEAKERDYVTAERSEPDPVIKLEIYARAVREIQQRLAPLFLALRDASATEPEALEVWQEISTRRADNMRHFVRDLQVTARLRDGLSVDDAADIVWATNSSELYVMLTAERGWSPQRFERFLADSWRRLLLDEGAG